MRNILVCLMTVVLCCGFFIGDVSAKRFGGGRSFGIGRSHNSLFSKSYKRAPNKRRFNKSNWGGILGGILIGGLLTSLFMGHGLANGLMTWMILAGLIFLLVTFLRKKVGISCQAANSNAFNSNANNEVFQSSVYSSSNETHSSHYPSGFDEDSFLRTVKVTFIRMQAAYDQKNIQDIHSFTTPEVYAEINMQLKERGDTANITEVINLNAKLLDVSKQADAYVASVHFTGNIKENDEPASKLDEIWHFYQTSNATQWVVGGIQQASHTIIG